MLLAPAVVNNNNLHANCLSMDVLTKHLQLYAYFKVVTYLFLHVAACFPSIAQKI